MTTVVAWAAFVLCIGLTIALGLVWKHVEALQLKTETPAFEVERRRNSPVVLFPAPQLDGMSLRDWLRYHWQSQIRNRGEVWQKIVDEFYHRASEDPMVAPYFNGYDLDDIKRKFLATLLIVTHSGVTDVAAARLIQKHDHLGIEGPAYDRTIQILVSVLADYGVPRRALDELNPMVKALREGLVTS